MSVTPAGCIDLIFRRLDVFNGSNVLVGTPTGTALTLGAVGNTK